MLMFKDRDPVGAIASLPSQKKRRWAVAAQRRVVLLMLMVLAACGGSGSGSPSAPDQFSSSDLTGIWNITMNLQDDTCSVGAPGQLLDVWEFAAPGGQPGFITEGINFSAAFSASGNLTFTYTDRGVVSIFQGQLTSRSRLTGNLQVAGGGCSLRYSVTGAKL